MENAYTIDAPRRVVVPEGGHMERRRSADRELRRLELADKHRRGLVDPGEREPWERALEALERGTSRRELLAALAALRARSEFDYAAVRVVYGTDSELRTIGSALQKRADAAVEWLADRMPAKIEVPVSPVRRDDEIRALAAGGVTQAKIAERFGVSQQAVSKILRREAA